MSGKLIAILCLTASLQTISFSQLGTFYPFEAQVRGITEIVLGLVIGSFSIAYILSAVVTGKYLSTIDKMTGLKCGLLLIIS